MKKLLQITTAILIGTSLLAAPAIAGGKRHGGWGHKGGYHYGYHHKGWGHKKHYGYGGYYEHGHYDKCWKWVKYYYGWKKVYTCGYHY